MWKISLLSLLLAALHLVKGVTAGGGGGVSGNDELADPFPDLSEETLMLDDGDEHGGAESPTRLKRSTTGLACRGYSEKRGARKR